MALTGRLVSLNGPVAEMLFPTAGETLPAIGELLNAFTVDKRPVLFEIIEHASGRRVRAMALASTVDLARNSLVTAVGRSIEFPVGEGTLGRVLNPLGDPIDEQGLVRADVYRPIHRAARVGSTPVEGGHGLEVLETGIKIVDLLFPLMKGSKTGILGGAALGKSLLTLELIHNIIVKASAVCVFAGVGERIREGNELVHALSEQRLMRNVSLVFGQMNESPGIRVNAALAGVTLAEDFLSRGHDVLLFIDSVFRFVQAGSEVSAMLGYTPSETGYQPTMASEVAGIQERMTTSMGSSITAIEAVYVPSDDLTDPAVVCISSYLDQVLVLSRERVQMGLYPAIDPLQSSSSHVDESIVGSRHTRIAQQTVTLLKRYEQLRRIVAVIGIEELPAQDQTLFNRARRLQNFLTQPFFTAHLYTGKPGQYVSLEQTLSGCERVLSGDYDEQAEETLYMIGALEPLRREG